VAQTLQQTYSLLKSRLSAQEAKMIIEHVSGYKAEKLITAPESIISEDQFKQIDSILSRRFNGEPLTRILGVREFWGLEFEVTPDVLDPRPDTETLVEQALKFAKSVIVRREATKQSSDDGSGLPRSLQSLAMTEGEFRILDLGTGTGCIPIALLSELPHAKAVAVDKSPKALDVARRNAEKHEMSNRIEFVQSDWFEGIKDQEFDLILSNPPYIAESVIENLEDEVKNHDPILALSGGESGLDCYKKIISGLKSKLSERNRAFLEIGYDQRESVSRLVDESNLSVVACHKDLAGHDRVLEISTGSSGDK
jgi:release factor glutamine methyltransferase